MNKYLVQITEHHGEFIDADEFQERIDGKNHIIVFIIMTKPGSTNPPRIVAQYDLKKIYGFREV